MKALLGALVLLFCFAVSNGQTNCGQYQQSCGKCYMNGCSYYWGEPGLYNSAVNGSCISTTVFNDMMWRNQYRKTVFAYALPENEVNTTLGQRKLSVLDSARNYLARPVLCFDRHLCYCKPMPPPPPSRLRVIVVDALTLRPLSSSIVMLDANLTSPKTTNTIGLVEYFPIAYGSYIANATLEGYLPNSKPTGAIGANMTVEITIPLTPLPCTVTVKTFSLPGKVILPGVSVTLGGGLFPVQLTPPNGTLVFVIQASQASGVTGTIAGYSDQAASFVCTNGGTPVVELIFPPIPNRVTILVKDARNGAPITTAQVNFASFPQRGVDAPAASTVYIDVAAGSYTAGAFAAGYLPNNSVPIGPLGFNEDKSYTIFLTELPCGVSVVVLNQRNNAPVPDAAIAFNDGRTTGISSATGTAFFSILFDAANNASASKLGFRDGFSVFNPACERGRNITVTIVLVEIILLKIAARDVASPSRPYILNALISWNGVNLTQSDPQNPQFRLLQVDTLPVSGTIFATARGFNPKTTDTNFTETGPRNFTVSLAPQDYTLYFTPEELVIDAASPQGRQVPVPVGGFFSSNYSETVPGIAPNEVIRDLKNITLGGFAIQLGTPKVQRSYSASVDVVLIDGVSSYGTYFAAKFSNIVPTSLSPFTISLGADADLDNMVVNRNNTSPTSIVEPVPNYGDFDERTLLFFLPYRLNAAFILVRVFGVNAAKNAFAAFGPNDFVTCTLGVTRFANYPNVGGVKLAVFEYPTTFGETITGITIAYPTETYSQTKSGWTGPESPPQAFQTLTAGSASETAYTQFSFVSQRFEESGAFVKLSNGQTARDLRKSLYLTRDFLLVFIAKK